MRFNTTSNNKPFILEKRQNEALHAVNVVFKGKRQNDGWLAYIWIASMLASTIANLATLSDNLARSFSKLQITFLLNLPRLPLD